MPIRIKIMMSTILKSFTLENEKYLLRIPSREDIPFIFSASKISGFNAGLGWDPMGKLEDHLVPHVKTLRAWEDDRGYSFAITSKSDEHFLGRISIRKTDEEDVWNIGFWTHPHHQKRGVMTSCVALVLKFGFEELNAKKIEADYATWNTSSKKSIRT